MRGYIEINPFKDYRWIDLPQDAKIKDVKYNEKTKRVEIHYKSKSGEMSYSRGEFGFEYISFSKGVNVDIAMVTEGEIREIEFAKAVDCENDRLLIVIAKWRKE